MGLARRFVVAVDLVTRCPKEGSCAGRTELVALNRVTPRHHRPADPAGSRVTVSLLADSAAVTSLGCSHGRQVLFRRSLTPTWAVLVAGMLAGCASIALSSRPTPSRPTIDVSLPPAVGSVVGGILRCYDLATPPQPQFQAGIVDVYRGAAHAAHQVAAPLSFGTSFIRARSWHRICGRQCALVLRRIRHRVSRVLSWFVVVGAFGLVSAVSTYALSRVVRLGVSHAYRERVRRWSLSELPIVWVACVSATLAGVTWWIALVVMAVVLWIGTVIASLWYRRHSRG